LNPFKLFPLRSEAVPRKNLTFCVSFEDWAGGERERESERARERESERRERERGERETTGYTPFNREPDLPPPKKTF